MDIYEEYHQKMKSEIELRTGTYCSYGRGIQVIYLDKDMKESLVQFDLVKIAETNALGYALLNFQVDVINMIKTRLIIGVKEWLT